MIDTSVRLFVESTLTNNNKKKCYSDKEEEVIKVIRIVVMNLLSFAKQRVQVAVSRCDNGDRER